MSQTRWPYGTALGFANHFRTVQGTTAGLFAEGDTTPDVTVGDLFYTNNTSATQIVHFDLQRYAEKSADYEGKVISVFFIDNSTEIANAVQVNMATSDNRTGAGTITQFMYSRSAWYQLGGSRNSQNAARNLTIGSSTVLNADDTSTFLLTGTADTSVIQHISGGYVGQVITLMADNSASILTAVHTGGNILLSETNAVLISVSGPAIQLVRRDATNWVPVGYVGSGFGINLT